MFLHKKHARTTARQLKTAVKLCFDMVSADLRGSSNVQRCGNGLISRHLRKELYLSGTPLQIIACKDKTNYVLTDEGIFSENNGLAGKLIEQTPSKVAACVYRGDVIVSAKEMGTYCLTKEQAHKVCEYGFSSMAVCADRIFGLYQNEVRYTAAGERDGWEKGEMITLPTPCNAIVAVDGKVYALGNTCYEISPNAEDIEFKFGFFAHNVGIACTYSPVNYNGRVVFATTNGLYQLSSNKISPIFSGLNEVVDLRNCAGTIYNGKYYLTCRSRSSTETDNDVTLILDLDEEEIVGVLDGGYESMCASDKLYVTRGGHLYWFGDGVSNGRFVKTHVNFATDDKKFLDRLTVKTLNDLEVAIRSENETRLYKIQGKKTAQTINLRDMGWDFSIELSSNDGLCVENLLLEAHICAEV